MTKLSEYRRLEWMLARTPNHLRALAYTASLSVFTALALPNMPNVIPRFFQRTLQIGTWADMTLFNLYALTYVVTLWVSTVDLLRVWILPVEEGFISLYMSKPIRPAEYLRARLTPILVNATLTGLASQAAAGLAVWHLIGPFDRAQFIHASALIVSLILFLHCFLNFLFLYLRERYFALVLSLCVWTVTLGPTSLYIYRPDLFTPLTRAAFVFPANLLWHQSAVIAYESILLACLLSGSILFHALAGVKLRRAPLG